MGLEELSRRMSKYYETNEKEIEYTPNKAKIPTFNKQSQLPAVNAVSQSNNPPSVQQPRGNALDIAKQVIAKQQPPRQMGVGFTPIPQNPYAKKVSALPYNPAALQKAQAIAQQAQGKTPAQLRQQNLANIKRVGDERANNINKVLDRADAALKSNNWMGKISATGDALINNMVKGAQERVAAYENAPAPGTPEYLEWIKNRGRITDPTIDKLIVQAADKFGIDPTQYSPATQEFLKDEQEARERLTDGLTGVKKDIANVAVAIGDVLQNKMIEATTGVPYKAIMAATSGAEATQRKLSEGKSAAESGWYGVGSAGISAGIESLGGIGGGVAGTTAGQKIMRMLPEGLATQLFKIADTTLARLGVSAGSEGFEEAAEYVAQWAWESLNEGKVMPFSWEELWENVKIGSLTGGTFEGANIAINGKTPLNPDDYISGESYRPNLGENAAAARMAGQLDRVYGANKLEGKAVLGGNNPQPGKLPTITRREQRALDALSKQTGVNIQIDDDIKGSNGYFDRNTNTLHISRNSNNAVYQVAAHEITHSFESNPTEWNQLYEIANANLSEDARSKLEYVLQKTGYTDAEMQSEVVSHYVQQCVTDIKSFEQLVGVNRTLAQRIVDAFESFVRKLTGQKNIGSWQETAQLREFIGDIAPEQAQQTLAQMKKALAAGGQTVSEGIMQSKKLSDNGVDTKDSAYYHHGWAVELLTKSEMAAYMTKASMNEAGQEYMPQAGTGEYIIEFGHEDEPHNRIIFTDGAQFPSINRVIYIDGNGEAESVQDVLEGIIYGSLDCRTEEDVDGFLSLYEEAGLVRDFKRPSNDRSFQGGKNGGKFAGVYSENNKLQNRKRGGNSSESYSLKLSPDQITQNINTAVSHFGTTNRINEAGYLTVDGRLLDFSGKHDGAPGGYRTVDHRDIRDALGLDYGGDSYSGGMIQFMSEGNIRLAPESGGINLSVKPTEAQETRLKRYIQNFGGEVIVDFDNTNGDTVGSVEYPARTPASLILQEIRDYFDKGKLPEKFDYSRKLNREALQEMAERSRTGIPYAPGYVPKEARKPTLPYNPNATDWYEKRVDELRESIKDLRRNRRKKVGGYYVGMYTGNGSDGITISITTPDGDKIREFVEGGEYWTNEQLQHEIASLIAEYEGYSAEEKQTAQPALPYNPNAPKPLPQNPAQGKFGGNMGIVANPEAVARAQERMDYFMPKPNPEGSRNIEGSVLDNLGQGEAAFATLDNLLAQSKLDAAKKPDAKEGIANVLTERPKKGVKENIEIAADFAARKLIDSGRTIDTIGKAVDDKVLYPLYNNAKQSRQAAEYMIGDAQTDINGKRVGDSLVSIFDPIKSKGEDYFRDFSTYLYHVHNVDRMSLETNGAQVYQDAIMQLEMENPMLQNATREEVEALASGNSDYREAAIEWLQLDDSLNDLHNKPVFGESVTAEDSRKAAAELARKNPEFRELAEKVYAYNRNLMKYRVDAGLVSQKQADIMNALYPHYVPTFRDTSSTTGMKMGGNQATVARTVRSASGSNLDLMPIDGSMAEQTLQTVRAAKMNIFGARLLEDALKHQDKVGRHIRSVVDKYNSYDMDEPPQYTGGVTIYSAGKPVSMDADVGVMEAFKSIQPDPLEGSNIYRRIVEANNTFKALVTGANPMFLAKNFARDLQDAGLYAGDLKDFAKNYPKAWKEIKNNGELWQLYKSQGGTGSSYFDYEKGLVDNKRKGVGKVFDKVEAANMMVEQAPRFAEFMSVLEKEGRTYEGIQKAMLAAADVTVNFGRSGTLTKTLNKTFVPFLNPSVQGADKFVRRFAQTKGAKEWFDLIGRCALLGIAPALLNELLHAGTEEEEEYAMLNDRDKETNYVFSIGDGVWVKIPRGRAVSIFGSAAQRTARTLQGKEDAWAGFIELALDQVGTTDPFTGHILSSYLNTELFNPESPGKTWYGGDIEPQRLQGLPPGERYDEKTDNLSKWLGKQLNISPKKINHLLDSYTGVIGDFALPLMTPKAERNPFAAAFSIDSTTSNKLQGEFYDKLDELEQGKNSTEPTAGADLAYSYLNGVSREVSELNKQIRAIEADETIKDKDKREQTRKLAEERNNLIKEALEELPSYQEAAAGYKGDPDDAKREVNRKQFGAEYALKKYNKEVYENAQKANKYLIPYETFYDVYFAQKDLKSDKDSDGKTIKNSLSKKKKAAIDKTAKSLTQKQKEYLYDMFGVSKSEWNKLPTKT